MFSTINFMSPKIKCKCGSLLYFPNGYYPARIICSNCGATITERDIRDIVSFPNKDLNKTDEELKQELHEAIKKRDESRSVVTDGEDTWFHPFRD